MNPISSAGMAVNADFSVAVVAKVNDAARDQGEAELKLIQSSGTAEQPQKASSGSVGTQLHVVA